MPEKNIITEAQTMWEAIKRKAPISVLKENIFVHKEGKPKEEVVFGGDFVEGPEVVEETLK